LGKLAKDVSLPATVACISHHQAGASVLILAAGVLFGFAAMAADVGMILHQARELQNTAGAAQAPR
jgi:ABC-type Na+ efflux pump permease subunit